MNFPGFVASLLLMCIASMLAMPAAAQDCSDPYDPYQVLDFYIAMDPQDWEELRISCPLGQCGPRPYTYYEATLRCEDGEPIEVGIRRKNGRAEPSVWDPQKPALKLDINEFVPEQRFAGKLKLSLENGSGDSLVSEGVAWQLYQAAGVVASRAAWVNVHVNGELKGLYVNVEQIDKTFLADHGIDNGGWLFKREEQKTREGELNPFAFNWYPFDHALRPDEEPTPLDWREQALWRVDMSQLLTLGALENFVANMDGFFGGRHNYWYYDWSVFPDGQRPRLYLAWDLDFPWRAVYTDLPMLGTRSGHLRQGIVAEDIGFQTEYLAVYANLLDGPLALPQTLALVDAIEPVLTPHLNADPYQTLGPAGFTFGIVRDFLEARTWNLLSELGTCPDGTCSLGESPCTCAADCGPVAFEETDCSDAADEDCDGFVDCSDGDCAVAEECVATPQTNVIRVVEVLANSPGSPDVEYVELHNAGPGAQDLTGWYLIDDDNSHDRCSLEGSLNPGAYLVVAGDIERFTELWDVPNLNPAPFDSDVAGQGFGLGNEGDQVRLFRPTPLGDELVHGFTLGVQGEDVPFGLLAEDAEAPEYLESPSPGVSNEATSVYSPVCINEFLTTSQSGGVDDWVELYNRGGTTADISGWHLSDRVGEPTKYTFPEGTVIPPGAYLTLDEGELGFGLSSTGSEVVMLTHADGVTGQDYLDYGPQFSDVSLGRFPDGGSAWHFFALPSPGVANACDESTLDAVTGFRFGSWREFFWDEVAGAQAYDVVKGDLQILRSTSGDYGTAVVDCRRNNADVPPWWDEDAPSPGTGVFYLVRAVDFACGYGTYDTGSPSQAAGRDAGIETASGACP
jgi:hypothetical protein